MSEKIETVKIKYMGSSAILHQNSVFRGKVMPGDEIPIAKEVYERELKEDWRWELVKSETKKTKKNEEVE